MQYNNENGPLAAAFDAQFPPSCVYFLSQILADMYVQYEYVPFFLAKRLFLMSHLEETLDFPVSQRKGTSNFLYFPPTSKNHEKFKGRNKVLFLLGEDALLLKREKRF